MFFPLNIEFSFLILTLYFIYAIIFFDVKKENEDVLAGKKDIYFCNDLCFVILLIALKSHSIDD